LVTLIRGNTGGTKKPLDPPEEAGVGGRVHVGTVIGFESVVTVSPNAKILPSKFAKCPTVTSLGEVLRIFPTKVGVSDVAAFAPRVVVPPGAQNTSQADAPPVRETVELSPVVRAPPDLKIYVPAPSRVTVVLKVISMVPLLV
jgi:hypothetical protein